MSAPAQNQAAQAKAAQRWVGPNARPKCGNCLHADEDRQDRMPPFDSITWRCRLGAFVTAANAVCGRHTSKLAPGSKKEVPPCSAGA